MFLLQQLKALDYFSPLQYTALKLSPTIGGPELMKYILYIFVLTAVKSSR